MNLKRKCQVLLLPTNGKANFEIGCIVLHPEQGLGVNKNKNLADIVRAIPNVANYTKQNLYFLSDDKIKEGDWYYTTDRKDIVQCTSYVSNNFIHSGSLQTPKHLTKKIIATTDTSLIYKDKDDEVLKSRCRLPQPSTQFIQKYIESYNAGTPIEWINVEYEEYATETNYKLGIDCSIPLFKPKVDKNNYITITKVKDSWNKDEVKELLHKCWLQATAKTLEPLTQSGFKTFIEENL